MKSKKKYVKAFIEQFGKSYGLFDVALYSILSNMIDEIQRDVINTISDEQGWEESREHYINSILNK